VVRPAYSDYSHSFCSLQNNDLFEVGSLQKIFHCNVISVRFSEHLTFVIETRAITWSASFSCTIQLLGENSYLIENSLYVNDRTRACFWFGVYLCMYCTHTPDSIIYPKDTILFFKTSFGTYLCESTQLRRNKSANL
jgi:hypothetical protein